MAEPGLDRPHALPRMEVGTVTEQPSALDRIDPSSRNAWGFTRAAGPTDTDRDDELAALRRENAALRRLNAAIEEERLSLIRLAEARDRGPITTNDPRGTA